MRAGGGWPATFADVAAAIDHLAVVEGELPLDLDRVVTIGHSAGGHLALWAGARPGLPDGAPGARPAVRVTHAVAQAGVSDLGEAARLGLGGGAVRRLLGGTPVERPEPYALGSPLERLPLGVPQLLVHGEEDDTVPVALSRRYAQAAAASGDRVDLSTLPGVAHFEHIDPSSQAWKIVTDWLP